MFNMLFGKNPLSDMILATLGLTPGDFGRFRDCYIKDNQICVYTRCGGGNREDYQSVFDEMEKHPCYYDDQDDDFDSTYATFYFSFPAEFAEDLAKLGNDEKLTPSEKWIKLFEEFNLLSGQSGENKPG